MSTYTSVEDMLHAARQGLRRLTPAQAEVETAAGAMFVDIRPAWQRTADGEIPGAVVVERNHLEWRLHPGSGASIAAALPGQTWIVYCTEGYTSSLAARALLELGIEAADLDGGIMAWRHSGRAVRSGPTPIQEPVAQEGVS